MNFYCHLNNFVYAWISCCATFSLWTRYHTSLLHKQMAHLSQSCGLKKVEENVGGERNYSNMTDLFLPVFFPGRLRYIYPAICKMQRAPILIYQKNLRGVSCWEIQDFNGRSGKDCGRLVDDSMELQTELRERFLTQNLTQGHKRNPLKPICEWPDYSVLSSC